MTLNKKVLVYTGAGIAVAILLAFGITQCSQKQRECNAADEAMRMINDRKQEMADASNNLKRASQILDSLIVMNTEQADSIVVLNDSIAVLNDSLDLVQGQLVDCRNGKKKPVVGPRRPQPVRPQPVRSGNGNRTNINLQDNSANNEQIVVQNDGGDANETQITLGNGATNNGQIVVNNGGNVTISANRAAIDSLRNAIDTLQMKSSAASAAASSVVIIKKVKTYSRTY